MGLQHLRLSHILNLSSIWRTLGLIEQVETSGLQQGSGWEERTQVNVIRPKVAVLRSAWAFRFIFFHNFALRVFPPLLF